ncbi:kinase-like domain-containing protein [Rhizophagus irregularis DAOM 181602=DAOM 197198]|nr:kinase-like domain-containing protein [Rhizophagus irregularis DAOM 181602=DAOM 197198]
MICEECNKICLAKSFQQNFKNWTSGNSGIDKFIQNTQLSDPHDNIVEEALEWIPYNRFYDIEYIAKGGFGKVYRANWIDGPIKEWDLENENWKRGRQNKFVALKILDNSKNVTLEFMNEIISHHKLYENDYVDANPLNRPTSDEISKILKQWGVDLLESRKSPLSYETHSEAIYTSRLLDFNNLPEPKNFDNYYEQYDNITSMEYSESQQIDISQLKINE